MDPQCRKAAALGLARAELAAREEWLRRNLYLPPDQITPVLLARKNNARAALRWYIGEIRSLRMRIPGLATSGFDRAARKPMRGGLPGHPVQLWTRAVSTNSPTGPRASWIPLPLSDHSTADERP